MKTIKFLSMMLCLVASMAFAACGGDDGGNGGGGSEPPQTEDSAIVKALKSYKWKTDILNIDVSDAEDYVYYEDGYVYLFFLEDGDGIEVQSLYQLDSDGYEDSGVECYAFNYYIDGDNIIINRSGDSGRYLKGTFKLDGNKLVSVGGTLYGGCTFKRESITKSDYKYIPSTGSCGNNCTWTYEPLNKKLTISGSGDMYDYTDNDKTPWDDFYIEWVKMDDDVTSVGNYAFYQKTELNRVDFSYNLRRIGKYAFQETLVSEISLRAKVEHIGKWAFAGCSYLQKAYLSGGELTHIDDGAFIGCENLSVSLENCEKLQTIGANAFNNVAKVSGFTPSQVLTSVGAYAFTDLKVKTLELPNSLTEIEWQAFCGSFSTIRIGNGVTNIADNGFVSTASSGNMYVNMGTPPATDGNVIADGTGFSGAESKWTLYVPVGCKSAYSKKSPWNKFKSIVEDSSLDGSGSSDGSGENSDISGDQLAKYIIGTWKDINSYYEDNRYYFLQDGNGYVEHSVAYDGVYRAAFQWAVEDDVVSIVYIGGSEYKYNVVIDSETMELTNTKNGKTTTYNKINNNGTTSVDYRNPPFVNYVEMYGNYYPLSKAIMRCKHAVGTNANMKHLQFFGDNEELTPMGVWFTYSTPYYEGINKEWSDGTYSIKSDSGFWIYSGAYCYRGTTYNGAGTLKIKTVNSVKVFDFTLDGGDIVGHLEGNWSYD